MAKGFAWSFSKLKNYETCPKKHYEVDIAKHYNDTSEALTWGNTVHDALAKACAGTAPLPETMAYLQKWVDEMRFGGGKLLTEQKYALTRNFKPTEYFAPNVWYRGVCDVVRIDGPVALARDWKTGKILDDSVQLALMASCLFAHHPTLQRIRTEYVWLKDDCTTGETWTREDIGNMWSGLMPRVQALETAAKTMTYAPRPSGLCVRYCPVTSCVFHGKGAR